MENTASLPSLNGQKSSEKGALVSVCIPVYNGKRFVEETIQSVLLQNYPQLEIIVQDNGSTDGTWELLCELTASYPQLSIARNETNVGMAPNWNLAIGRAKGDYVMLLSADDLLEPGFIFGCLDAFAASHADVVTTNHFWLRDGGKKCRKMKVTPGIHRNFSGMILLKNPFSINFTLFSRPALELLQAAGGLFAVKLYSCDYDLWIRTALAGIVIYYLDTPLGTYRVHESNLSRQATRMYRHATLVLLRHERELRRACGGAYRFTLLRFICRNLLHYVKFGIHDKRHTRILWGEFCR